jgi:putative membrane protein
MLTPPSRPTNDVTELARERSRAAVERTLVSWINSALLLMGLGISIHEIASEVERVSPNSLASHNRMSMLLSLGAIAFGIALLIPIAIGHRGDIKALERGDYLAKPPQLFNLAMVIGAVIVFGLIALVDVLFITTGS